MANNSQPSSIVAGYKLHVGELRWKVTLATQEQLPNPSNPAEAINFVNPVQVWAKIDPVKPVSTLLGVQTQYNEITHNIFIRATGDYLENFTYIIRNILKNDNSSKTEIFRIHTMLEIDGRQRFVFIQAELISSGTFPSQFQ